MNLTLQPGDPRFDKIRYVFQGARALPEVRELNFQTMQATLRTGGQVYFSEVRNHVGDRLRLVDIFGVQGPEQLLK